MPAHALRLFLPLLLLASLTAGCAVNRATGGLTPGIEINKADSYYVIRQDKDGREINAIIAKQLKERGFNVDTGEEADMPAGTVNKVTYVDRWMWDITMYMLELTITMSDAKTDFTLATGNSYHTSLTRLSPEEMVAEVLSNMLDGDAAE